MGGVAEVFEGSHPALDGYEADETRCDVQRWDNAGRQAQLKDDNAEDGSNYRSHKQRAHL